MSEAMRPTSRSRAWVGLLLLLSNFAVLLPASAPASAAFVAGWGNPLILNTTWEDPSLFPEIALDADGNAVLGWWHASGCGWGTSVAAFDTNGGWTGASSVHDYLCNGPMGNTGNGIFTDVAAAEGRTVVLFNRDDRENAGMQVVFRQVNGNWGTPIHVEPNETGRTFDGNVVLADDGVATVIWHEGSWENGSVSDVFARRVYENGTAGPLFVLDDSPDQAYLVPRPRAAHDGTVLLAWQVSNATDSVLFAGRIAPSGALSATGFGDPPSNSSAVARAHTANARGDQALLGASSATNETTAWIRTCPREGEWSDAVAFEPAPSENISWAEISMGETANFTMAWTLKNGSDSELWARQIDASGGGPPLQQITTVVNGSISYTRLALAANGRAAVAWIEGNFTEGRLAAATLSLAGSWSAPTVWPWDPQERAFTGLALGVDSVGNTILTFSDLNFTDPHNRAYSVWAVHFGVQDIVPPAVVLGIPPRGPPTNESSLEISGSTEPGSVVEIQANRTEVKSNGTFSARVDLSMGNNTIIVVATDPLGNSAERRVVVERVPPTPPPSGPPPPTGQNSTGSPPPAISANQSQGGPAPLSTNPGVSLLPDSSGSFAWILAAMVGATAAVFVMRERARGPKD